MVVSNNRTQPHTATNPEKAIPVQALNQTADDAKSDSELSSLLDEPQPPKKKRGSRSISDKPEMSRNPVKKSQAKSKSTPDADDEVKKLQGWLLKCGVRKQWKKELARCSTEKEKIRHLRDMLADVGMSGRFSEDKARKIKEQREFEQEMADIKEGAMAWGRGTEIEEESTPRRRRLQPKGLQDILEIPGLDDSE